MYEGPHKEIPLILDAFSFLEDLGFTSEGYQGDVWFRRVVYTRPSFKIEAGISPLYGFHFQVLLNFHDLKVASRKLGIQAPSETGPFTSPVYDPSFHECLSQYAETLRLLLAHPEFEPP